MRSIRPFQNFVIRLWTLLILQISTLGFSLGTEAPLRGLHLAQLTYDGQDYSQTCTGFAISATRVITAAHCIVGWRGDHSPGEWQRRSQVQLIDHPSLPEHGRTVTITGVHVLTQYPHQNRNLDIAKIDLAEEIPGFSENAPILRDDQGLAAPDHQEGSSRFFLTGYDRHWRARSNTPIRQSCSLTPIPFFVNPLDLSNLRFVHGFSTNCGFGPGASGGPVFLSTGENDPITLVGILHASRPRTQSQAALNLVIPLAQFREFLQR